MEKENRTVSKAMNILQKMYHYRLRIDRKDGKAILNWSSLFSLACLLLAPHMTIAGIVLSLILGYHINLETDLEGQENQDFEQRVRQAADTVRKTATAAAQTIRSEIEKNTGKKAGTAGSGAAAAAAPAGPAQEPIRQEPVQQEPVQQEPVRQEPVQQEPVQQEPVRQEPVNQDVVQDLEKHAYEFQHNPTARSAFSAMGSSVPTLQVEESAPAEPGAKKQYL
ncbi:MAG: hypothetical protein J6U01_02595 [Clostridia bacterium]|nr:hypothetical protein [Clostridia bacterium]